MSTIAVNVELQQALATVVAASGPGRVGLEPEGIAVEALAELVDAGWAQWRGPRLVATLSGRRALAQLEPAAPPAPPSSTDPIRIDPPPTDPIRIDPRPIDPIRIDPPEPRVREEAETPNSPAVPYLAAGDRRADAEARHQERVERLRAELADGPVYYSELAARTGWSTGLLYRARADLGVVSTPQGWMLPGAAAPPSAPTKGATAEAVDAPPPAPLDEAPGRRAPSRSRTEIDAAARAVLERAPATSSTIRREAKVSGGQFVRIMERLGARRGADRLWRLPDHSEEVRPLDRPGHRTTAEVDAVVRARLQELGWAPKATLRSVTGIDYRTLGRSLARLGAVAGPDGHGWRLPDAPSPATTAIEGRAEAPTPRQTTTALERHVEAPSPATATNALEPRVADLEVEFRELRLIVRGMAVELDQLRRRGAA